jgi:hypothetical protein
MPPSKQEERRRHRRSAERRPVRLCFSNSTIIFAESLDRSDGGLRLSPLPYFRLQPDDRFAVVGADSELIHNHARVVAVTPAGIHLQFADGPLPAAAA